MPVDRRPADDTTPANIQIADSHTAFPGHFRVHRYLLSHRRHAGGWTGWMTREQFERRPTVGVLLYDPRADAGVLLTQFRPGAPERRLVTRGRFRLSSPPPSPYG